MRIAITGATGNVGTALVGRLIRSGHDLVGLARRLPRPGDPALDNVEWVAADLTDDECGPVLESAFAGADAVVHLVWGFQPTHRPAYLEALGVGGTRHVLEAVAASRVPHLVHMSSIGAYAKKADDVPVDESYPTTGIPSSPYSRHKAAAERLLDEFDADQPGVTVTRIRSALIGHPSAASSLLRYAVPALVPAAALRAVPVLPLDRSLRVQLVHVDDVAEAFTASLETRLGGAFNVASEPPITVDHVATALGARHIQLPAAVVRAAASVSWHLRLQQVDAGWVDMAYGLPLLDTTRARTELSWSPAVDGPTVLEEVVAALVAARHGPTPALRPRSVADGLRQLVTRGPVAVRREP